MKPARCIDSVMKCCQWCEYGHVEYPYYPDVEYFETTCIYGLEGCEPTEGELKEFNEWCATIRY